MWLNISTQQRLSTVSLNVLASRPPARRPVDCSRRFTQYSGVDAGCSMSVSMKLGMCGFTVARSTYFRQFPVVEVQQTFYDPPSDTVFERWRADAPAGFEFTMKAWQAITHRGTS